MRDGKNITKNDMIFFQNELLTDLKKLELQTSSKITNLSQTILAKTTDHDLKITKINENINELISKLTERKFDSERIEELLSMKNKFSEQIIENQSRISIIDKALENSIYKYDKIILDNLQLPGVIGSGCKFKNCRMFFENIHNELKLNQKFKEEEKASFKGFQEKVDIKVFKLENEINRIHQNINQICQTKFEKFYAKLEERLQITDNMINSARIENSKYADELIQASTSLKIQWERLENIKNEIYQKFFEELEIFKKIVDSANRKYYEHNSEFKLLKQRFTQLAEYIKDFKNQKKKDYKELLNNINFNKKQKLDNDYDFSNYDKIGNDVIEYIKSSSTNRNEKNQENNPTKRRDSFSAVIARAPTESKKVVNMKNISPTKPRRYSMINRVQQNIGYASIKKDNRISQKNVTNYTYFNKKAANDNIIKVQTMTVKRDQVKRQKLLNELGLKTEKKIGDRKKSFLKIMKNKTIVTENNIDLNFESKKQDEIIKNKNISELSDEDDDLLSESESSNFSISSMGSSSESN